MSFRMLLAAVTTGLMSCSHPSQPAGKQTPLAARMSGFSGLDRLSGFERGTLAHPPAWAFDACRTQDFRIPGPAQELGLRQTMYCGQPRITTQSWTLLANATPVDTWFFNPAPRDQQKVLAPYEINEIISAERGRVVFRTTGEMHRPGGHGWMQAKDFVFEVSQTAVEFQFVVGRYFFTYQDTKRGSGVGLITERVVDISGQPRIEIRDYDAIPQAILNRCGFRHPLLTEEPQSRHEYEQVAECLRQRLSGKVRYRNPDEPSFIERR